MLLLGAKVDYIMCNPTNYLEVRFIYDTIGDMGGERFRNVFILRVRFMYGSQIIESIHLINLK